jgi:hypothetical protein
MYRRLALLALTAFADKKPRRPQQPRQARQRHTLPHVASRRPPGVWWDRPGPLPGAGPNHGLQATANSLRSSLASAIGGA